MRIDKLLRSKTTLKFMPPHTPRETTLNLELAIISSLPGRSARQVGYLLKVSEKILSYHLRRLKTLDVIEKIGYGTWKVKNENISRLYSSRERVEKAGKQLRKLAPSRYDSTPPNTPPRTLKFRPDSMRNQGPERTPAQDSIAGHGFLFVLSLPALTRWRKEPRRTYLGTRGVPFVVIPQGERLDLMGWKVHLTGSAIVGYAPKGVRWYADTAERAYLEALHDFMRVVSGLETLLGVSLRVGSRYKVRSAREHHALVRNALAAQQAREGKKLFVNDDRGVWLLVDLSDMAELETVRAGEDGRDANKRVQDYFNGIKETGLTPQKTLELFNVQGNLMQGYAENIEKHVVVMTKIGVFLDEIFKIWDEQKKAKK